MTRKNKKDKFQEIVEPLSKIGAGTDTDKPLPVPTEEPIPEEEESQEPIKEINPLICIPSPRYIQLFNEHIAKLQYDKLWVKYYREPVAYNIMRKYFLEHPEYTHLVIIPDDLLVTPEQFKTIQDTVEQRKYSIVGGICNLSCSPADANLSILLLDNHVCPHPDVLIPFKNFQWARFSDIEARFDGLDVFRVSFSGFPCMFIERKIVEEIPFRPNAYGWSVDLTFCYDCQSKRIPIYADKRAKMLHLKGIDPHKYRHIRVDTSLVDRLKPFVLLERAKS